jgi:hypothetical protein
MSVKNLFLKSILLIFKLFLIIIYPVVAFLIRLVSFIGVAVQVISDLIMLLTLIVFVYICFNKELTKYNIISCFIGFFIGFIFPQIISIALDVLETIKDNICAFVFLQK